MNPPGGGSGTKAIRERGAGGALGAELGRQLQLHPDFMGKKGKIMPKRIRDCV